MRYPLQHDSGQRATPGETNAVVACPFCTSDQVATTGNTVSAASYWRCNACGEIWNPGRARSKPLYPGRRW